MWAVYVGGLKPGAGDKLDEYDDPFDVFVSYYETDIYRLPAEWQKSHGPGKQMDWGSSLYICDIGELDKLLSSESNVVPIIPAADNEESAKRLPAIKAKNMPAAEWYGVLEAELY